MFSEPLYKRRSTGEKLNITFDFLRENFTAVCRNVLVVAAPFCIIFAIVFLQAYMSSDVWNTSMEWLNVLHIESSTLTTLRILFPILTAAAVMPMAFTLIDTHYSHNEGIQGLRFKDLRMTYFLNLSKWFLSFLPFILYALLVVPVLIKGNEWFWMIVLTIIIFFFLEMAPPAFIIGRKKYGESMETTIRYAFSHFWNSLIITLLLLLVGLLVFLWEIGVINVIVEYKGMFLGTVPSNNIVAYAIYWILLLALLLVLSVSVTLAITALSIGIVFQYGSLEERNHRYELKEKIENFEKLRDE